MAPQTWRVTRNLEPFACQLTVLSSLAILAAMRFLWLIARLLLGLALFTVRLSWRVTVLVFARATAVTHGSARWATLRELLTSGSFGAQGIIVGKAFANMIRFRQDGFVLVFAPTRTGKGYSIVIPNLLAYPGSIIAIDIKGENKAVTARARRGRGPVYTLNLMEPSTSDGFNPLVMIQVGTWHEADDARQLADLMIVPTSDGEHWDEKARGLLAAIILYVCHKYRDTSLCTLAQVRAIAAKDWSGLELVLTEASGMASLSLREEATSLLAMENSPELKSIKSTMDKATSQWSADKPAGLVSSFSSFRFEELNKTVGTVYIMVPEEKLSISRGFLRVMIGSAITAMTRSKGQVPRHKTLLLLDEAAALGRLQSIEEGVGYLAAYMKMILVWQDLDQLQRTYSRARSIIANAGAKVAFSVSDIETARMLAEQIGRTTILTRSAGRSHTNLDLVRLNVTQGVSEAGRYLVDPAEIMRLPSTRALILMPRQVTYPMLARKVMYWRERRWKGLWDRWRTEVPEPMPAVDRECTCGTPKVSELKVDESCASCS